MVKLTKKPPAKAKTPAKKVVKKTTASKKVATKKANVKNVVKKTAVKKPVAKKSVVKKPVAKKPAVKAKAPAKPKGMPEQMLDAALKVLDERQAEEIVSIPLAGRSSIADYLIIASGRSGRQLAAIADHLREAFSKLGIRQVHVEGQTEANWVLVDAGDIIIHLFLPDVRSYYDLDTLWNVRKRK